MNRKLRVLMLSLFVVMFSAVSAFAYFTSDDIASFVVADEDNFTPAETGGYNYVNKIILAWPEDQDETPQPVSWTISPDYEWLEATIGSYDVMLRGILPDESKNYTVHVIAELNSKVLVSEDEDGNPITADAHISADVNMDAETGTGGLEIAVEKDETKVGLLPDLVSVDVGTGDINTVDDKYSVRIDFPMTWSIVDDPNDEAETPAKISGDLYPNAKLEAGESPEDIGEYVNLPQWLGYELVGTPQKGMSMVEESNPVTYSEDPTPYVKTLQIFFTSKDYQPKDGEKAVVRIAVEPSDVFTDEESAYYNKDYENGATIGWEVTYKGASNIVVSPDILALTVERGESADVSFDYSVVAVSGNPTFSPDVTGVTFTPSVVSVSGDTPSGKIIVSVSASDASQAGTTPVTMTVNDANGGTVTATINLTVVNPITITASGDNALENVVVTEGDAAQQFIYTIGNPLDGLVWSITGDGASMLSPASGDSSVVLLTLDPRNAVAGNYTATLEVHDNSGRATRKQTFSWTVESLVKPIRLYYAPSGDIVSVDFGASADLVVGYTNQEPTTIIFSPDISADVKLSWDKTAMYLNGIPNGTITIHAEPLTPRAKLYSTDIIVTDENGATASLPIFISVDVGVLSIEPVSESLSVELNTSKDVLFMATNHSGVVSWDIGIVPTGITVTERNIPDATQYNANGQFTVTGLALGTYSVDITATDERGEPKTATLYVNVTPRIVVTISPDIAEIVVPAGLSRDVSFTATAYSGDVSWDVGTVPTGLTVAPATDVAYATQHNTVMVYTVTAASTMALGTYSVDITATDATGSRKAKLNVEVVSEEPKLLTITPASTDASVVIGGASANVSFAANNNIGNVTWTLGTLPTGVTVAPATNVEYATQYNTRMVYTVTATSTAVSGDYSITVTAKDSGDKPATATINVKVTKSSDVPVPGKFAVTPASGTASVTRGGASANVSFAANNNSGDVTWTLGTLPTGVTVAPATNVGYATQYNTRMVYTVTAATSATAGNYSVTVTAKDAAGNTATATISITVSNPTPPVQLSVSPSSATATVTAGVGTATVSFTASGNSGTVSWTVGTTPTGITVTSNGGGSFTVSAASTVTAGSYSATVTATDAANRTANATINITVESVPVPPNPEEQTEETKELINKYASEGKLNADGTIPSKAVSFTPTDPTAKTLNPNSTTTVRKGENLNPVALALEFPVDIWKIYINNVLMAWAYSPGVTPAADDAGIYASAGENGIIIEPSSNTEATVVFNTELMPAGDNQQIAAAFVPDATKPTQEIGKTTLATVSVSSTTSPDIRGVGSSSGGCDAGLGAIISAIAAAFFISKKRS